MLKRLEGNKKGFTLIELIVVIAIIAILVLLAAPKFLGYTRDANVATMRADAKVLSSAALLYNIENEDKWPVTAELSTAAVAEDAGLVAILGTDKVLPLDETKIKPLVKNTKGELKDYVLVVEGDHVGDVFHATGVKNRADVEQFGVATIEKE